MLSEAQIAQAKKTAPYHRGEAPLHEHDDCVRMAHEWLSAQERTKGLMRRAYPIKHMIERWAGRYVSQSDVEVAAHILGLRGDYPRYDISSRLIEPNVARLNGVEQANTQGQRARHQPKDYARRET